MQVEGLLEGWEGHAPLIQDRHSVSEDFSAASQVVSPSVPEVIQVVAYVRDCPDCGRRLQGPHQEGETARACLEYLLDSLHDGLRLTDNPGNQVRVYLRRV